MTTETIIEPQVTVTPLKGRKFGAVVELPKGVTDPSKLSEEQFKGLFNAVHRYLVVVIPNQESLPPESQLLLAQRFDPQTGFDYGHGKENKLEKSILSKDGVCIPRVPQVQILGNGDWEEHEGLKNFHLYHPTHFSKHKNPLDKDVAKMNKQTRFFRWHIDSAFYDRCTPVVTTLLGIDVPPEQEKQTIVYADDPSQKLVLAKGATGFVDGSAAFDALSAQDKELALNTTVVYAPHPYIYVSECESTDDGLTIYSDKKELPLDELPPWDESKMKKLPLVWTNPVTGKQHLQVHGWCVYQLERPDGILQLEEARKEIHRLMRPAINPENVYAHPWHKGDLCIFFNRGVWHTVTGEFDPHEKRLMHQCNVAASSDPICSR